MAIDSSTFLGKTLYVIHTRAIKSRAEIEKVIPEHLEYQVSLEKRGIMWGAGPLFDDADANQGGMIIYRAGSFADARAIADADPMHKHGVRGYTIQRWKMNEGTVSIRVSYSDQRMTIE